MVVKQGLRTLANQLLLGEWGYFIITEPWLGKKTPEVVAQGGASSRYDSTIRKRGLDAFYSSIREHSSLKRQSESGGGHLKEETLRRRGEEDVWREGAATRPATGFVKARRYQLREENKRWRGKTNH